MNILVCINSKFKHYMSVMLNSLSDNNKEEDIKVFCLNSSLTEEDKNEIRANNKNEKLEINFIDIDPKLFANAPTVKRYPQEIYYRLLAYKYLPKDVDRILYMVVDLIVKGSLKELYNKDFDGNLILATTNIGKFLNWFNRVRLGVKKGHIYLNSGVMMMNIKEMRNVFDEEKIYDFIRRKKRVMALYDEDVLFALYGDRIGLIDSTIYNLSDRQIRKYNRHHKQKIDYQWVVENNKIIHYLGKNKPWKDDYKGILKPFYDKYNIK